MKDFVLFVNSMKLRMKSHFLFQCSLYDDLRSKWVSHIANKTLNFLELDKIYKFKAIFDIQHGITAKFFSALLSTKKRKSIQNVMCCVHFICVYV